MVVNSGTLVRIPVATLPTNQQPQHPLLTSEVPDVIENGVNQKGF
jgi:hypothetical protein